MEIMNHIAEYIGSHLWAVIVLAVLYIAYEIIIRRIPTDSPYYSIVHTVGKGLKFIGKLVIKIIGENMSKETEKDDSGKEIIDEKTNKPRRRRHK